ncbi:MAG: spermidine/putrescine ABC transporter substrate-binding protein [Clostridiales bacterium]|nr:spermidine/putrescine ABC transporter substrate-binding protein [Clostridiales bacterium]
MKKIVSLVCALVLVLGMVSMGACGKRQVINVFNWGEYISDGSEGSLDINKEFEKRTGIHVNYTNYDSNEVLYSKLSGGGASYDVVIPSDYMIERLISEGLVQKIDMNDIPNYKYIPEEYKGLFFDKNNEYSIPYTVGLVGLIYNKKMVTEKPTSWNILWDSRYTNKILNFNNSRDAFGIAQYILGQDVNTTDPADWRAAADKLKDQKKVLQSYVMDEVFDIMENEEAAVAPYYAGDFLTMKEVNDDLEFVYPDEGTNIFVDSFCIPTNAKNVDAAKLYINFMLDPEMALANAESICYACPHTAVRNNEEYSLKNSEILYPTTPVKSQYFHNLDKDTLDLLSSLWTEVKQYNAK